MTVLTQEDVLETALALNDMRRRYPSDFAASLRRALAYFGGVS